MLFCSLHTSQVDVDLLVYLSVLSKCSSVHTNKVDVDLSVYLSVLSKCPSVHTSQANVLSRSKMMSVSNITY